jgi:hypothetical protein
VSERRRFFGVFSDSDVVTCPRCGGRLRRDEMARDASRMTGRKSICVPCDREKSRAYYAANREHVLAKAAAKRPAREPGLCSECGEQLEGQRRVVCSSKCAERRFRRTNPESYAARERAKVERRREKRRAQREGLLAGQGGAKSPDTLREFVDGHAVRPSLDRLDEQGLVGAAQRDGERGSDGVECVADSVGAVEVADFVEKPVAARPGDLDCAAVRGDGDAVEAFGHARESRP